MTSSDGAAEWARQRLIALRVETQISQSKLAEKAGIARETYNKLETGNRTMTVTYAAPLALALTELLGRKVAAADLLPPAAADAEIVDPLALLRELSATVDAQEKTIASHRGSIRKLQSRVRALEQDGGSSQSAGEGR